MSIMDVQNERLDIIVMGATGFAGRHTVYALNNLGKQNQFTWGIAGRNPDKLQRILKDLTEKGHNVSKIPVIIANINDYNSLLKMTAQAKVVINCCGPYRFYGEPVVKACIQTKTHHLDVSGEPQYMEEMQLHFHDWASEQGVYIISACGMSGVPADVGVDIFEKIFNGTVNSIEIHIEFEQTGNVGSPIHYGTWASLIHSLSHIPELQQVRKKLFTKPLPSLSPRMKDKSLLHKSTETNQWCLKFAGADRSVVYRSQYFKYLEREQRPIQSKVFLTGKNFILGLFVIAMSTIIGILGVFGNNFTRNLLLKYPKLFTAGLVSHEGPTEEQMNNAIQHVTFIGHGWTEKSNGLNNNQSGPPNKSMKMKFSVKNPGYGFTCYAVILAALTVIKEYKLMPGKGGVYPPGFAFSGTTYSKQLQENGVEIKIFDCKKHE